MDGSGAVVADRVASEDRVGAAVATPADDVADDAATSPKDTIVEDAEEEIQPDDANTSRKRTHDAIDAPSPPPPPPTSTSTHPHIPPSTHTSPTNGHDTTSPPKAKQQKLSPEEDSTDADTQQGQQQTQQDPVRGGAPLRRYLNKFVTPALLDGMKLIAREQPNNPLERLAMFLLERSKDAPLVSEESISKE
ncbi:hypothetical protein BZA70DRAFT_67202 [Myxozyma melibiosi]|uniref:Uncharacterized protein n=1 Tax=Myxozyma melibiosi TaxID=54550 RepID=A0ABR1F150_9ASCO